MSQPSGRQGQPSDPRRGGGGGRGGKGKGGQGAGGGTGRGGQGKGGQGKGGQGKGGKQPAGRGRRPREDHGIDETVAQLSGPLQRVLQRLPETQRKVLELRMGLADGHPHDLADTARALGLSMSEARDIEKRAFEHIREAVPLQQLQKFLQGPR